jgi:hypothetical protein
VEKVDGSNTPLLCLLKYLGKVFFVESRHVQLLQRKKRINVRPIVGQTFPYHTPGKTIKLKKHKPGCFPFKCIYGTCPMNQWTIRRVQLA